MKRILLDGRALQPEMDGIGRFTAAVSARLAAFRPDWDFTLMVSPGSAHHLRETVNLHLLENPVARFRPQERQRLSEAVGRLEADACLNYSMAGPVWDGRHEGFRIPTSFVIHDTMVIELKGYFGSNPLSGLLMRSWYRRLVASSVAGASTLAVPTQWVKDRVCGLFPDACAKTLVVYEGQDLFDPRKPEAAERGGFLLYVGNARVYKNLERLILAYRSASSASSVPDLVMVVRRDRAFPSFARFLERSGAGGRVRLLSSVSDDELKRLYGSCTAFVSPSIWEGFGLPVLEAMAAGCPVIASRGTALEEVAGDGALLVDPADTGSIAQAIGEICGNSEMREELSVRARARSSLFGWDSTTGRIIEMLEGTVKS